VPGAPPGADGSRGDRGIVGAAGVSDLEQVPQIVLIHGAHDRLLAVRGEVHHHLAHVSASCGTVDALPRQPGLRQRVLEQVFGRVAVAGQQIRGVPEARGAADDEAGELRVAVGGGHTH
jgi:hypothetical protein